ncbi:MAG TPA: SurA N-terminal domain-containing protein [Xanthobacteraceae bacterium]|nr:SurA N-terminal domain-containing protein [Xanthobacteraceae bacterium]
MRDRLGGLLSLAAAILAASLAAASPAAAQQVAAMVNGTPITTYDIEQRSKFMQLSTQKTPPRQEVLQTLIDERIKVQEAGRYNMDAPKAEVDRAISNMATRAGLNLEQFTQALAGRGVNIDTIRSRMRAEIAWNQLVRARFPATLAIEEKEVRDVIEKKGGEGDAVAYDYRLRQILFIVPKGSPQSVIDGRMREAEALRSRFENCEDGVTFARSLRDVAVRDPVRRSSADLPDNLREVLNSTPVGKLTKPEVSAQGVAVFALCEKRENKTDTPQNRAARNALFSSRFEAQSKRYLRELRRQAMIEMK